jgi:hypothetical protein
LGDVPSKRIVTNSDLDALVSAVLLKRVEPVGAVKFLPHERIKDGTFRATREDIVVNMPFIEGCGLWFDHHSSNDVPETFEGLYDGEAPSAARVVYRYYRERGQGEAFDGLEDLLEETDKVDSAQFEPNDISHPTGAVLLSFLIDSHPLRDETVAENQLIISLLDGGDPQVVLDHPVFRPRAEQFLDRLELSKRALEEQLEVDDGLMIIDFRRLDPEQKQLCNNKFLPYVIHEDCHTLLRVKPLNEDRLKLNLGFNMFLPDEECPLHYGNLLKKLGGGGHRMAAGCSVPVSRAKPSIQFIRDCVHAGSIDAASPPDVSEMETVGEERS